MVLPRLARALHHPGVATALGVLLIVLGIVAIASGEPVGWWALIIVAGVVNVLRGVIPAQDDRDR